MEQGGSEIRIWQDLPERTLSTYTLLTETHDHRALSWCERNLRKARPVHLRAVSGTSSPLHKPPSQIHLKCQDASVRAEWDVAEPGEVKVAKVRPDGSGARKRQAEVRGLRYC